MRAIPLFGAAVLALASLAGAQTVHVPPVDIVVLTHHYVQYPGGPAWTSDSVQFPCGGGACFGPGFTASIGTGDTIVVRFEAPTGSRFAVTRRPGGTQSFAAVAFWESSPGDSISSFPAATITFENLLGASPTPVDSLNYVSDNGHRIFSSNTFAVTGDFSFTALDVQFTVAHPLVAAPRTYDPVDSTVARSFLSFHSVSALAGDSFVMSIEPTTGTDFCFGDGTGTACPCGNDGSPGHGCQNSATPGARLTAIGTTSPDTIVLGASGEKPSALTVFLQGTQAISPVPFGDGLRCVHGVLKRLYTKHAWAGAVSAPQGGDLSITARSAQLNHPIAPGSTRYYMTYYRDGILGFCPSPMGSTFNSSNAWTILW